MKIDGWRGLDYVHTDEDGMFHLSTLHSGRLVLRARREGFLDLSTTLVLDSPGANIELKMTRTAVIEGQVFAGEGVPVAGCEVEARPVEDTPAGYITYRFTDIGGFFQMEVPAGSYSMTVTPPPVPDRVEARHYSQRLRLEPGEECSLELVVAGR